MASPLGNIGLQIFAMQIISHVAELLEDNGSSVRLHERCRSLLYHSSMLSFHLFPSFEHADNDKIVRVRVKRCGYIFLFVGISSPNFGRI